MKVNRIIFKTFIFIVFIMILNISPNVFAKDNKLLDYIWPDKEKDSGWNFYPSNDSLKYGTKKDPSKTEFNTYGNLGLREGTIYCNGFFEPDDNDIFVKSTFDYGTRYHWLHALKSLTDDNKSKDYKKISEENDKDTISKTISAVELARDQLNTFFNNGKPIKDKQAAVLTQYQSFPHDPETNYTNVTPRATSAFKKITKCDTCEEYVKIVNDQLVTLKLAEKYLNNEQITDEVKKKIQEDEDTKTRKAEQREQPLIAEALNDVGDQDKNTVFNMPDSTAVAANGLKDVTNDADKFIENGTAGNIIETKDLQDFSKNIYGMLLGIGIVLAVIIGVIIGVKLMLAPIEQRAETKKLLIPYVVGCIVVFGSFAIWKFVVTLMQKI